ncbi:MAG: metal ABC transporter permease [Candidatus Paceibacterota bacterium]
MSNLINILQYQFIERALIAGIFLGILCAVMGVFLVLRKMSLIGDGLAHISFGAIAVGIVFGFYPLITALPLVIIASLIIYALTRNHIIEGDAIIGILASLGLAIGVILSSISTGFNIDIFSYLFGNILAITQQELSFVIIGSITILSIIILFYQEFMAISFNPEQAKISGIPVTILDIVFSIITAITVLMSVKLAGALLVSALIILPASSSLQISKSFQNTILFAIIFALISIIIGLSLSIIINIPTGATIVIVNTIIFFIILLLKLFKSTQ